MSFFNATQKVSKCFNEFQVTWSPNFVSKILQYSDTAFVLELLSRVIKGQHPFSTPFEENGGESWGKALNANRGKRPTLAVLSTYSVV
jgi:hypothetical protein